jgi:serine/threonine-protein kinase
MRFQNLLAASLTAMLALAACGTNTPTATTTATSTPSSPSTASPTATATPTPTEAAKSKSLSKATKPAADVSSPEKFLKVKAENLQPYKYKSGLFELDIPEGWTPDDKSKPSEAIVLWFDPTKNALISVDIFNAPPAIDDAKMTELLKAFLNKTFGARPGFFLEEPIAQSDGSIQIVWGYNETIQGATGRIQGNSFIEKVDDKVSLLTTGVLEHQFDDLKAPMSRVINSYKVDASVKLDK